MVSIASIKALFGVSALSAMLIFPACSSTTVSSQNLRGVWSVIELETFNSSGEITGTNRNPLPSQAIFTGTYYSLVYLPDTSAMRAFEERWVPTEEEMIQRYGEIIVNSGRYTIEGSRLVLRPIVSRVPEFMGGTFYFEYSFENGNLVLISVDEYSFDGVQAPWVGELDLERMTLEKVEEL